MEAAALDAAAVLETATATFGRDSLLDSLSEAAGRFAGDFAAATMKMELAEYLGATVAVLAVPSIPKILKILKF